MNAAKERRPATQALCERAWHETGDIAVAVAAAFAARHDDFDALKRWGDQAPMTIEGARILHLLGEAQQARGDLTAAEVSFRIALRLRVDTDSRRAANTAMALMGLTQSSQSAEHSIGFARVAWEQASRAKDDLARAVAATGLVGLLLEMGELRTAQVVASTVVVDPSNAAQVNAQRLVQARLHARQQPQLAAALLEQVVKARHTSPWELEAMIELADLELSLDRTAQARGHVDLATELAARTGVGSVETACRLAAIRAAVALHEGNSDLALAEAERGLHSNSRDAARVALLNIKGDVLERHGRVEEAEAAWREAADLLETWRLSIPTVQLRSGLLVHHRHALESWLESTATRGDVTTALEITSRLVGRALLDRIRQREANEPTLDAAVDDVVRRLEIRRELAARQTDIRDLRTSPHDLVLFVNGARSLWVIRRRDGSWSIVNVGPRDAFVALVDEYRREPDNKDVAERLGNAMFPFETLPTRDAPLVVMLDRDLADLALAGLRSNGRYLVEHAPIMELVAPELVFRSIPDRAWGPSVAIGDPNGDLGGAAGEVRAVAARLHASENIGTRATRDVLLGAANARVLHVATHSTVVNGRAAFALFDGAVSSVELVRRDVAPRLAVIATCRSQVDDDPSTSLVAAFLAAGSAGVVGVKRSLDDETGSKLVEAFFRAGGADDPIRALAQAQRAAIASGAPPRTWASLSFFGIGGWLNN